MPTYRQERLAAQRRVARAVLSADRDAVVIGVRTVPGTDAEPEPRRVPVFRAEPTRRERAAAQDAYAYTYVRTASVRRAEERALRVAEREAKQARAACRARG